MRRGQFDLLPGEVKAALAMRELRRRGLVRPKGARDWHAVLPYLSEPALLELHHLLESEEPATPQRLNTMVVEAVGRMNQSLATEPAPAATDWRARQDWHSLQQRPAAQAHFEAAARILASLAA